MTGAENHTLKLLQQMREDNNQRFDRLDHASDTILKEVRFLRNHVFMSEDENQYWRNAMASLQNEIKALTARIESIESRE